MVIRHPLAEVVREFESRGVGGCVFEVYHDELAVLVAWEEERGFPVRLETEDVAVLGVVVREYEFTFQGFLAAIAGDEPGAVVVDGGCEGFPGGTADFVGGAGGIDAGDDGRAPRKPFLPVLPDDWAAGALGVFEVDTLVKLLETLCDVAAGLGDADVVFR